MELDQSSSVSAGVVRLMVTPPADAPVGEYSLTAEHREESAALGKLVLLFNPWCPGRFLGGTLLVTVVTTSSVEPVLLQRSMLVF